MLNGNRNDFLNAVLPRCKKLVNGFNMQVLACDIQDFSFLGLIKKEKWFIASAGVWVIFVVCVS